MAQIQIFVRKGRKVVPSHVVQTYNAMESTDSFPSPVAAATVTSKPKASGPQTKSIAQSLRQKSTSSFQGVAIHAGFRACRGNKIRCY